VPKKKKKRKRERKVGAPSAAGWAGCCRIGSDVEGFDYRVVLE
jgi:hypothetical protein